MFCTKNTFYNANAASILSKIEREKKKKEKTDNHKARKIS